MKMRLLLFCAYVSQALAAGAPFFPARVMSREELLASVTRGESIAAWGSTLLTDATARDASPGALLALRVAARRARRQFCGADADCAVEFDANATVVASARIDFSEDGVSASVVSVARSEAEAGGPLSWEEHPVLGRVYLVRLSLRAGGGGGGAPWSAHALELTSGVPDGDVNVLSHTWSAAPAAAAAGRIEDEVDAEVRVGADGGVGAGGGAAAAAAPALRTLSYNVWNSNPPRWLFRDPRDRFRQYALRMLHLGETVRAAAAGIVAFQEVRYDSTLGGFDGGGGGPWGAARRGEEEAAAADDVRVSAVLETEASAPAPRAHARMPEIGRHLPYSFSMAWAVASLWFNKTAEFSETDKYRDRNAARWAAVTAAEGWAAYGGAAHPREGDGAGDAQNASVAPPDAAAAPGETSAPPPPPPARGQSPFLAPRAQGPDDWARVQAAFLDHPHAQVSGRRAVGERGGASVWWGERVVGRAKRAPEASVASVSEAATGN
jgi:hypothetical protein